MPATIGRLGSSTAGALGTWPWVTVQDKAANKINENPAFSDMSTPVSRDLYTPAGVSANSLYYFGEQKNFRNYEPGGIPWRCLTWLWARPGMRSAHLRSQS